MDTKKLKSIKKVQYATEQAMSAVINYLKKAKNPHAEKAHEIIDQVLEFYNCESPHGHIVSSGSQTIDPHNMGSGLIIKNTPIVVDIFPRSKDTYYYADMTRTVCLGEASENAKKMYRDVQKAQQIAVERLGPNVKCVDIHKAVEDFFITQGYETIGQGKEFQYQEGFIHAVGHGVGKELHDSPYIGHKSKDVLKIGDVITVEPGLYYKNIGGIRIEDMFVITETGAEKISHYFTDFEIQ